MGHRRCPPAKSSKRRDAAQGKLFSRAHRSEVALEYSAAHNRSCCLQRAQHGQTQSLWKVSRLAWTGRSHSNKDAPLELPAHLDPNKTFLIIWHARSTRKRVSAVTVLQFLGSPLLPLAPTFEDALARVLPHVSPAEWARVQKCWTEVVNNSSKMQPLLSN